MASRSTLDWVLVAVGNLALPVFIGIERHTGDITASTALLAGLVSVAMLNTIIIVQMHARNKRHGWDMPRKLVAGTIALAVLSVLITGVTAYSMPTRNELVDLALSAVPLSEIHPERKAITVEFLRKRFAASRDYQHAGEQLKPVSPALYSPDSFASEAVIRSVAAQLKRDYDMDVSYRGKEEQTLGEFRSKMTKVDTDYLKSFNARMQEQETAEAAMFQLEQSWVTATLALYDYAAAHMKEISLKNGELAFTNDSVRTSFNHQLENCKVLQQKDQAAYQDMVRHQQQLQSAFGLPPQ
jgi:hypothetical protein